MSDEEIVLGPLPKGITPANEALGSRVWNVFGHTYTMKSASESSFAFETFDPPGTGVPPHVHPRQDEHIYVLDGVFTLYIDGKWETAGPGDTVRMPRNLPHAYYNRGDVPTRALFWVSPAGQLASLFDKLDKTMSMEEGLSVASQYGVDFLPPGAVEGV
ncbi:cupin domain-containing protein [Amycolatopsis sp. QT-25]|uniref:cupin domain-containing protein n=1 Tax=Amycolatopsis sp. QT-25 TaxID=3034022 RepID=UPI0023EE01AC|nr:cupin domain-containing protein [Amycolatopsis sp. QT-25]WET76740.1 cupin domain-containing protein [Amycolatopsis sp. QT-25]